MGRKKVIVKIETPCNKDWNSFTQKEFGGYCSHCVKTVVDFTNASDDEIFKAFEKNKTNICGRFNVTQLNREMSDTYERINSSVFNKFVAGILLIGATQSIVANKVQALDTIEIGAVSRDNNLKKTKGRDTVKPSKDTTHNFIEGKILNIQSTSISFASIIIKDTKIGVASDKEGKFKLYIPDSLNLKRITLIISSIGYETKEMVIKKSKLPMKKNFTIKMNEIWMGEIVITRLDD